jgi:hypothetical protein
MQDLSALTPPLLMCAVVVLAIVAFLRHEMNRSGRDSSTPYDNAAASEQPGDDLQSQSQDDSAAGRTSSRDT